MTVKIGKKIKGYTVVTPDSKNPYKQMYVSD